MKFPLGPSSVWALPSLWDGLPSVGLPSRHLAGPTRGLWQVALYVVPLPHFSALLLF